MNKRRIEKSNRIAVAQKIILFLTKVIIANSKKKYNKGGKI